MPPLLDGCEKLALSNSIKITDAGKKKLLMSKEGCVLHDHKKRG